MKKTKLISIISILIVIALTATTVFATSPYLIDSHGEFMEEIFAADNSAFGNAHLCWEATTKEEANQYAFCRWHDTSAQNALAAHSSDEFGEIEYDQNGNEIYPVTKVYTAYDLTVMVYHSRRGPNVTAIVGSSDMYLVGAGGGSQEANYAKIAFQKAYSGFMGKHLEGIVLLDTTPEQSWGVAYWRNLFGNVPVIVNAAYQTVRTKRDAVSNVMTSRQVRVYADFYTTCTDPNNPSTCYTHTLPWGVDGFLGLGSMRQYDPPLPGIVPITPNDIFVRSESYATYQDCVNAPGGGEYMCYYTGNVTGGFLTVNGIPMPVLATSDQDAGLAVFLPLQHIQISRDGGKYLPDVASLHKPNVSVGERIKSLNWILAPGRMGQYSANPETWVLSAGPTTTNTLITTYGMPIIGWNNVYDALTAQRSALKYLHDQTLKYISYGFALDDILSVVTLPPDLRDNPYTQEFVGTKNSIIRSVYHDYLGWFDGNVTSLNTFLTAERANRTVNAMGGEKAMLKTAQDAITEHTRQGAMWALELVTTLRQVYPSDRATDIYVQALRILAGTTKTAPERNYYLSLIWQVENQGMSLNVEMEAQPESIEP
jgi:hypothetical protein